MLDLTLSEKIGQMLMFGWQGSTEEESLTVCEHARMLVQELQVGGIVLMGRNISTPQQIATTLNEMQALSNLPLFTAVDQEGGMVVRLKHPFTVFPGNMALGATRSADYCRRTAHAVAGELAAIGINSNFAPCMDVNINPENPVIGVRSYGESPNLVAELGAAAIEGYQSAGVLACAKHFPGHGDTSVDSHMAMPVVRADLDRLDAVELPPFRSAADADVASVMIAHMIFAALDPDLPATLSRKIITGVLREEMNFGGLVITDCLEMKAITDNYGIAEAAVLAVQAGVDILLACHTLDTQIQIRENLVNTVQSGIIPERRIDESVARILEAKGKYKLDSRRTTDLSRIESAIGIPETCALEREIAERAVTLVQNDRGLLPLHLAGSDQIAIVGMHPVTESFAEAVRSRHAKTQTLQVSTSPTAGEIAGVDALVRKSHIVLIITCPAEPWARGLVHKETQTKLVNRVLRTCAQAIVIAVREPYGLQQFPEARTSIATYGYPDVSICAALDVIFGSVEPSGRLPVTVPGYAQYGEGMQGFHGQIDRTKDG